MVSIMDEGAVSGLPSPGSQWFATTHWSVVLAAGQESNARAEAALETLCRAYWPPLYAYVRQQGYSPHDAQDLTQAFFARSLGKHYFARASPELGRFRTFLLTSLKHFLVSEWRKAGSQKRGGGNTTFSWDAPAAEQAYAAEPTDGMTPETIYVRRWAATMIDRMLARLRKEYVAAGHEALFEPLAERMWGEAGAVSCAELARQLGQPEGTVRSSVHRLRRRCRELLREEVAQTVPRPEEIDQELNFLLGAFGA